MAPLDRPALVDPGHRRRAPAWEPVALRRADIARAVDQLLDGDRADAGLRRFVAVHPRAGNGIGLAPGIEVAIEVLAPGEQAVLPRRNSSGLSLQLGGASSVSVNGRVHDVGPRDVYSVPPFAIEAHTATGTEPSVRLSFSNAALLELLGAHHVDPLAMLDDGVPVPLTDLTPLPPPDGAGDVAVRNDGRVEPLGDDAFRLEYERLVDPPWLPRRSWHWPWRDVVTELDRMATLDERYRGRRVCLLHDPATGRTNGTTSTLFASMCIRPPSIVDPPHRHSAAAVNVFLEGEGWSTVDGRRIEWGQGDVVFIAPAWAVHHHASGDSPVYQLAVQDNPFHLAIGSLVWQEDLGAPPRLLGAEPGFTTNRHLVEP